MQPLREKIIEILLKDESYEVMADKILALMPGWISVDERLPEQGQICLAFSQSIHYCVFDRSQFYRHTEQSGNDRIIMFYFAYVTHWMPLPAFPPRLS